MRRVLFVPVVMAVVSATPLAQTPANPSFEVASIKENKTGPGGRWGIGVQPGGRMVATNSPLDSLIIFAHQIQPFQLIGAPDWIKTARYDIQAKASFDIPQALPTPGGPPPVPALLMRTLLQDRFKFSAHVESRDMPTFALVMARNDRKLGPNLKATEIDCGALMASARATGKPPAPLQPGQAPPCAMVGSVGRMTGSSMSMEVLARSLASQLNRVVLDRTELTGLYDFVITFVPDNLPPRAPGTSADQPIFVNGQSIDPNGPSLLRALEEQLGLRLESTRGAVEVLIIDRIERPTED